MLILLRFIFISGLIKIWFMKNNYCTLQNTLLKYLLLENINVLEVELREPALIPKTFKEL